MTRIRTMTTKRLIEYIKREDAVRGRKVARHAARLGAIAVENDLELLYPNLAILRLGDRRTFALSAMPDGIHVSFESALPDNEILAIVDALRCQTSRNGFHRCRLGIGHAGDHVFTPPERPKSKEKPDV